MTKLVIALGASPNDKTGDPLRTAFGKVNDNFTEVYNALAAFVPFDGGMISGELHIENTNESINLSTGALHVHGGAAIHKNLVVGNSIYIGPGSTTTGLANPTLIARSAGSTYIQAALVNTDGRGSADWVAYGDNGTADHGWIDMGFTGSAFDDPAYTITEQGEGYLFVAGYPDGISHGSLVFCTHDTGVDNDIVFGTGGFQAVNEKMRFSHALGQFYIKTSTPSTSVSTGALRIGGGLGVAQNINLGGHIGFSDGSIQSSASVSTTALKSIVAASTSFEDFQSRIAAL